MNTNIDLSILLKDNEAYMKRFSRDTYADAFKEYCEKYKDLFFSISEEYDFSTNSEELIKDLSLSLVSYIEEEYNNLKKSKRSNYIIDKNALMVIYVLPCINESNYDFKNELIDSIIALWNKEFNQNIKLGTFAEINAGFKRKLCYVTTAVCNSLGKPEDCEEIRLLKNYRDTYLSNEPDGKELIDKYYDIAPTIVNRINKSEDSGAIYKQIYNNYINPCIRYIESDRMAECKDLYVKMMHNLNDKYMI